MEYRTFGQTGLKVSALGFGAMRLPNHPDGTCDYEHAVPLLHRGIELGINYIDSAWDYLGGTSEVAVGKAIKSFSRQDLHLATKIPITGQSGDEWRRQLETQLDRLGTDYVDFHLMHALPLNVFREKASGPGGPLAAARKAQQERLIHHRCFSSHDTPENIRTLIDTGEFAGMLVQYNLLDRSNEEIIAHAQERGMGVAIMGPVGGGRLAAPSSILRDMIAENLASTPAIALRFVLSNPAVSVALSGMNEMAQIEENTATASRREALNEQELRQIAKALDENERLAELYCTGCGYCMPCPNGVNIPENFRLMNYHRLYGLTDYAREQYIELGETKNTAGEPTPAWAAACVQCGECEPKCPQNISIIEQLKQTHRSLAPHPPRRKKRADRLARSHSPG